MGAFKTFENVHGIDADFFYRVAAFHHEQRRLAEFRDARAHGQVIGAVELELGDGIVLERIDAQGHDNDVGAVLFDLFAGVFQPLDRSKLPNWNHLDPKLMKLLEGNDPGNKFAVPYMYGTILIGFNPDKVKAALGDKAPVDSWDLIFKEENISKLKQCGVALLDSPSEILPLALQHLGLDPNSKKPADYEKAEALLMKIRPYITYFHSSKYMADIANGDICVAVGYSGSFSQAANRAKEAKNGVIVDMRLPKEGAPIWFDMLAIPKGAKNPEDAYTFINYLLQPQVIAPVSDFVGYPNPNKDATELVDPAIRNNPNLYPTETAMGTLYTLQPLPRDAERARTRAWTKIKSGT